MKVSWEAHSKVVVQIMKMAWNVPNTHMVLKGVNILTEQCWGAVQGKGHQEIHVNSLCTMLFGCSASHALQRSRKSSGHTRMCLKASKRSNFALRVPISCCEMRQTVLSNEE